MHLFYAPLRLHAYMWFDLMSSSGLFNDVAFSTGSQEKFIDFFIHLTEERVYFSI